MDDFLYSLAEMKYRMWHELYKFKPQAYTSEECFARIKYKSRYEHLLEVINILPVNESNKLNEIEQEYFSDAPYVTKLSK